MLNRSQHEAAMFIDIHQQLNQKFFVWKTNLNLLETKNSKQTFLKPTLKQTRTNSYIKDNTIHKYVYPLTLKKEKYSPL